MSLRNRHIWEAISSIKGVQVTLLLVLVIILGLLGYGKDVWKWKGYCIETFLPALTTVFITSIGVGLFYEILIRRKNLEEAISLAKYGKSLNTAGICEYETSFRTIDFQSFFHGAKKIDIMFIYGRTWAESNSNVLLEVLSEPNTMVRFCITNPNSYYLKCLEDNWYEPDTGKYSHEDLKKRIQETIGTLKGLYKKAKSKANGRVANLIIYLSNRDAPYSFYRSDSKLIFVPKKICKDKTFPTHCLRVKESESRAGLFERVLKDFDNCIEDGGFEINFSES